jgi:hypothetical protein
VDTLDHPLLEVAASAQNVIENGGTVYQKFTCAGCGERLAMDEPNVFYETGTCDKCDTVTDIKAQGCNFVATFGACA